MKNVKITIDQENGTIAVWNDGKGIPVRRHMEYTDLWVPELIFGHLLTSSNYDDNEKKTTGGRNGYGAKLTNIYSTEFTVETSDSDKKKLYSQTWSNNMADKTKAEITSPYLGKAHTCITFKPDLKRFGMERLDDDIVSLFTKRAYDFAGIVDSKVKISLNGELIKIDGFRDYIKLYIETEENKDLPLFYEKFDNWEICVTHSDGQF
jgi:DNA topoisomerase-2